MTIKSFYSDDWCREEDKARTQDELQEMAKKIRIGCNKTKISYMDGYVCTEYSNDNLGLSYWVHDEFGHISQIIEGRKYAGEA